VHDDSCRQSTSRRRFLSASLAVGLALAARAASAQNKPIINAPALLENEAGGYRVLPAGQVFCGGVVPVEGHEIVHALFRPWVPLQAAWGIIETHLKSAGRPIQALCGMELRIAEQLTPEGFRAFNAPYIEELRKRDLIIGRYSAVCRTNVAPASDAPAQPMVHAFSYCTTSSQTGKTFCLSGTADIDGRGNIVAEGDVSPAGMRKRLRHCVDVITERLTQLELEWTDATHIDLCLARDIDEMLGSLVVPGLQGSAARGIRVHHARPPIVGAEVELECRGVRQEIVLAG
jgi:hypothetical protein